MPPKSRIWRAAISWPGWRRQARIEHVLDARVPLEQHGDRHRVLAVLAHAHGERLDAAQHEPARRTGPGRRRATSAGSRGARRSSGRSSRRSRRSTSEWPPRYFVVEWTTTSAPSSSGRCRYGVANVLSTTSIAPTSCAASAAARMSTMFSSGFVGDSIQTMRVFSSRCSREVRRTRPPARSRTVALRLVDLREHPVDAAVDVGDQDDALAGIDEVHDRRRRAEARRERDAVVGALERREALLQRRPRRVRDARVVVALVHADRLLHVRRRLVDRRRHRARRRIGLLAVVDRAGLEVHGWILRTRGRARRRARWPSAVERASRPSSRPPRTPGSRMERLHDERALGALGLEVGAADEAVAPQERQHVVAVDALVLPLVDLDQVVEAEHAPRNARSQSRLSNGDSSSAGGTRPAPARRRGTSTGALPSATASRSSIPSATSASTAAGCARAAPQPPVLDDRRLGQRAARGDAAQRRAGAYSSSRRHGGVEHLPRDHPLRQVVEPLEPVAARDHEPSGRVQRLEHRLRRLPVPHPALRPRPRSGASRAGRARRSRAASAPRARARARRRCRTTVRLREPRIRQRCSGQSSTGSRHASCAQYSNIVPRASAATRPARDTRRRVRRARSGGCARRPRSSRAARTTRRIVASTSAAVPVRDATRSPVLPRRGGGSLRG